MKKPKLSGSQIVASLMPVARMLRQSGSRGAFFIQDRRKPSAKTAPLVQTTSDWSAYFYSQRRRRACRLANRW